MNEEKIAHSKKTNIIDRATGSADELSVRSVGMYKSCKKIKISVN